MPDNPGEINFPGNSRKSKKLERQEVEGSGDIDQNPNRKMQKVITGEIVQKKKRWWDKVAETFLGDDVSTVSQFVLFDVLIPSAKSTIVEMIKTGAEMLFFGEIKGSRTFRDKSQSIVNYAGAFRDRNDRRDPRDRDMMRRGRSRYDFDSIIIDKRSEGELVLSALIDLIDEYGQASVADFYDALGMTNEFVDNDWGWTKLGSATVDRVRDGYILNMPKPIQLDR